MTKLTEALKRKQHRETSCELFWRAIKLVSPRQKAPTIKQRGSRPEKEPVHYQLLPFQSNTTGKLHAVQKEVMGESVWRWTFLQHLEREGGGHG